MADRFSDPEELERYIERTRKDLARNVDEIADRVNPKNVANRGVERLKEEAGQVARPSARWSGRPTRTRTVRAAGSTSGWCSRASGPRSP